MEVELEILSEPIWYWAGICRDDVANTTTHYVCMLSSVKVNERIKVLCLSKFTKVRS